MRWKQIRFPVMVNVVMMLGVLVLAGADRGSARSNDGATLTGVVRFEGRRPNRPPINMVANKGGSRDECRRLHKSPVLSESAIVSEKGELANVFLYVKKGLPKKEYPLPSEPAILDQSKCMFRPRVQGIRVGQELVMRNSDELTHNVRSYAFRNRAFNVAQPAGSDDRKKIFKKPERAVQLGCDIHRWMKAFVFALDHPFFAVSDAKGQFKIDGLPAGEYTVAAWHEDFGEQEVKVKIEDSGSSELSFTFKKKDAE